MTLPGHFSVASFEVGEIKSAEELRCDFHSGAEQNPASIGDLSGDSGTQGNGPPWKNAKVGKATTAT